MTQMSREEPSMDGFGAAVVDRVAQLQTHLLAEYTAHVDSRERELRHALSTLMHQNMELIKLVRSFTADGAPATSLIPELNEHVTSPIRLNAHVSNEEIWLETIEEKNGDRPATGRAKTIVDKRVANVNITAAEFATHLRTLYEQIKRVCFEMGCELSATNSAMDMPWPSWEDMRRPKNLVMATVVQQLQRPEIEVPDDASAPPSSRSTPCGHAKNICMVAGESSSPSGPVRKRSRGHFPKSPSRWSSSLRTPSSKAETNLDEKGDDIESHVHEYFLRKSWWEVPVQVDLTQLVNEDEIHVAAQDEEAEEVEDGGTSKWVIHPSSRKRLLWDVTSIILLSYDLVMIPVTFAFQLNESFFQTILTAVTIGFWSFDMVMSSCTGFYSRDGKIVMSSSKILRTYAARWLPLDLIIIGLDWVIIALDSAGLEDGGNMRTGRLLRGLRMLRIFRLLRLTKLQKIARMIQDHIDSEYVTILVNVAKQLVCILATCHFVACTWYRIGIDATNSTLAEGEDSWITVHHMEGTTLAYKYCTSLHWSLTQFTPASMSVNPYNVRERLFAVVVLLYAMVIFSSFVSSITSAMTNLRNLGAKQSKQFWLLRKYFRQQHISVELSNRVCRYVSKTLMTQQTRVQQKDVELIAMLSAPLRIGLQTELYEPQLVVHPFFQNLARRSRATMRKLCCLAIQEVSLSRADVLFTSGETAREMYFLGRGGLIYAEKKSKDNTYLHKGQWFCEAVLWVDWVHRGTLCARFESELLALDAKKFQQVMMQHPTELTYPLQYGQDFVDALNQNVADFGSSLSDVIPSEEMDSYCCSNPSLSP